MFYSETVQGSSLSLLPRLDRLLLRYDLSSTSENNLVIGEMVRIQQSACPTCLLPYPPLTKESFFLVANNQFKLRLYNASTAMCRQTVLGPAYGDPVQQMLTLPQPVVKNEEGKQLERYMAFITHDKVGVAVMPMSGNPYHYMATIAHPVTGRFVPLREGIIKRYVTL